MGVLIILEEDLQQESPSIASSSAREAASNSLITINPESQTNVFEKLNTVLSSSSAARVGIIRATINGQPKKAIQDSIRYICDEKRNGFCYPTLDMDGSTLDFPGMRTDNFRIDQFLSDMSPGIAVPGFAFSAPREDVVEALSRKPSTLQELALNTFLICAARSEEITSTSHTIAIDNSVVSKECLSIAPESLARSMCLGLELFNVEDLFPNHPWKEHEKESASACYHTLAAKFIRLGDFTTASECIDRSDGLENSPRSFALRALIANARGETLSAIADMISSLKEYEARKVSNDKHYLHFNPTNFEGITGALQEGLAALNNQKNEVALKRFAEAVFEFDPFYSQSGLSL